MAKEFDVVVVGARCAGSPLATQLAQAGLSVALVDKDSFPSDTPSTHFFQAEGLASLARLGVLDQLKATGAPVIEKAHVRAEDVVFDIPWPTLPGDVGGGMCVRRPVLDSILVERARDAGADVRTGTRVVGLSRNGGRISGVRAEAVTGPGLEIQARLVVGADGRASGYFHAAGCHGEDEPERQVGCIEKCPLRPAKFRAPDREDDLYNDHMSIKLTATEAKAKILALLDEVAAGEEVEITKHGRTVARLVPATGPHALEGALAGVALTAAEDDDLFTTGATWDLP